jgi:hypothetical protein
MFDELGNMVTSGGAAGGAGGAITQFEMVLLGVAGREKSNIYFRFTWHAFENVLCISSGMGHNSALQQHSWFA